MKEEERQWKNERGQSQKMTKELKRGVDGLGHQTIHKGQN